MEIKSNHKFNLVCNDFRVKAFGEDNTITIEGYANTTGKDRQGDVILEEAWTKGGLDNYLKNPIVLAYHNPEKPIGEVIDYGVNNRGLHVVADISKAAGDVYTLIKEGVLKAFSVGFKVKDADYDTDTDIFVIKDLEMYELSVVSIPANADSIFSIRKSFEDEEDYLKFKKLYKKQEEVETKVEAPAEKEIIKVEKDTNSYTSEQLEEMKAKAVQEALDKIEAEKARKEEIASIAIEASTSGAERLLAEFQKKLDEDKATIGSTLEELRAELKEKTAEIESLTKNKMVFDNPRGNTAPISDEEIDTAVLASKALGKDLKDTEYFKSLITKATGAHVADLGGLDGSSPEDWENRVSTRLYEDIKDRTIIEPLFRNRVQMTSRTMVFPYNPEAGVAQWIAEGSYRSTNNSSTGTAVDHKPLDNTIKAEKLASKEYIGYEEEEDAIIALMPIIRDAVVRRMVRTTDTELLRANNGAETISGQNNALIDGVATLAADINSGADYQYVQPGAFGDPITIADLQQTRKLMGAPGLMPGDVVYVLSQAAYFDLLEDPDFRTMDLVGANATILRGQIGSVNGSPVLISDAFAADATSTVQAICLNQSNYLFGELRGMMVERDRDIENQKNILVATRRFGFTEIVPAVAAATNRQSYCANLVRPAS
jgi:HK97 family phage prohead protease